MKFTPRISVSLKQPLWRLNLERELALCSDVAVSLQQSDSSSSSESGHLLALVRRLNNAQLSGSSPTLTRAAQGTG